MTLPELASEMHEFKRDNEMLKVLSEAFSLLPEPVITFADAYKKLVRGGVEQVPVDLMENRVVATGVVPYPPGIPLLLPGERTGEKSGPILLYLKGLQNFDRKFPGFEHDTHGVEVSGGQYMITCIKEEIQ